MFLFHHSCRYWPTSFATLSKLTYDTLDTSISLTLPDYFNMSNKYTFCSGRVTNQPPSVILFPGVTNDLKIGFRGWSQCFFAAKERLCTIPQLTLDGALTTTREL